MIGFALTYLALGIVVADFLDSPEEFFLWTIALWPLPLLYRIGVVLRWWAS